MGNAPEELKPKFLDEESRHLLYSTETAEKHYKNVVYYRQRKGGDSWFHGRVSGKYRHGYDRIRWE